MTDRHPDARLRTGLTAVQRRAPLGVVVTFLGAGLAGPWLAGGRERLTHLDRALLPPTVWPFTLDGLLGTDHLGRSELLRLVAGARGSVIAVLVALTGCLILGGLVGVVAGWAGGMADRVLLRVVDVASGLPSLLLGLVLAGLFGGSSWSVAVALALTSWPPYARVVRSQIRVQRGEPRTHALTLLGASPWHVLSRHLLPATSGPVAVLLGISAAEVIVAVATFSYLGLGARPPVPEWGTMIVESQPYLTSAPWLLLAPTVAVTAVAIACTVLADRAGSWFTHGVRPSPAEPRDRGPVADGVRPVEPEAHGAPSLLAVRGVTVELAGAGRVVDGADLTVEAGRCVAVVGSSGSGKTMLVLALLGLFPAHVAPRVHGSARLLGRELLRAGEPALRDVRGGVVGYVPQDLGAALNPLAPVGRVLARIVRRHTGTGRAGARRRALELLREVGLDDVERVARQRPAQLSGGMRQRVLIAAALAGEPALLVADEPTSALDAETAGRIVDLLAQLQRQRQLSMIIITHELDVALRLSSTVAVMDAGRVVETLPVSRVVDGARHPVTRRLLAAAGTGEPVPRPRQDRGPTSGAAPLLQARAVRVHYPATATSPGAVGLDGVDLQVGAREIVGVVGPSGCGKSSLARALAGVEPHARGQVAVDGRPIRPRDGLVQLVFQDPSSALDPRRTVRATLAEAARLAGVAPSAVADRVDAVLHRVPLDLSLGGRRPWQLSGGERQRLVIARCLLTRPRVLVLDEPVSALDSVHRLEVLELLERLRLDGLGMVLISHDQRLVARLADRVMHLRHGRQIPPAPARRRAGSTTDTSERTPT